MYGVTASRSLKRDRYVQFCNCQIVNDNSSLEWKYPFRCQIEADGENVHCPHELKDLAHNCIKFLIDQNKTVSRHTVKDNAGMKAVGIASEQDTITDRSLNDAEKNAQNGENSSEGTKEPKSSMKQSASPEKKTDSSTKKTVLPKKSPELSKKSPKKKAISPPSKGFFGGWMFYRGKELEESDSDNNDKDDTLVKEDNDSLPEIQFSPQSVKSDSQVSCVSYHTASGVDEETEIASDYDKEIDGTDECFFDSWEFLNSPAVLKGSGYSEHLASINGKDRPGKHGSGGFIPVMLHSTSSHEFYIEDADTGQGHIFNTSQLDESQSFSLDEILEADSGLGSITHASSKTDQYNCTSQLHVNEIEQSPGSNDKEPSEPGKSTPDNGNKDEEVITTVSAVDIYGLQCPETELVPFTHSRSWCSSLPTSGK